MVGRRLLDGPGVGAGVRVAVALGGVVFVAAGTQAERPGDLGEEADGLGLLRVVVAGPVGRRARLRVGGGLRGLGRDDRLRRRRLGAALLPGEIGHVDELAAQHACDHVLEVVEPLVLDLVVGLKSLDGLLQLHDPVLQTPDILLELRGDLSEVGEALGDVVGGLGGLRGLAGCRSSLHLREGPLDAAVEVERRDVPQGLEVGEVRLPLGRVCDRHGVVDGLAEIREVGGGLDLRRDRDRVLQHLLGRGRLTTGLGGLGGLGGGVHVSDLLLVRA